MLGRDADFWLSLLLLLIRSDGISHSIEVLNLGRSSRAIHANWTHVSTAWSTPLDG
jgi:hypothetical protein